MVEKLPILLGYALLGLLLGLWPLCRFFFGSHQPGIIRSLSYWANLPRRYFTLLPICLLSLWLVFLRGQVNTQLTPLIIAVAFLGSLNSNYRRINFKDLLGLSIGMELGVTLLWWLNDMPKLGEISRLRMLIFGILAVVVIRFLKRASLSRSLDWVPRILVFGLFALAAVLLSFNTGPFLGSDSIFTAWHHWGAYIGPSELLLTGAQIFKDFPAQYGLGPTVLIASACGSECWSGMYYVVGFTSFMFCSLIGVLAFRITEQKLLLSCFVFLVSLLACFFWDAFPLDVTIATATPSVGGLRFLPVTLFVSLLIYFDRDEVSSSFFWLGHFLWAAVCLWSPESAFYGTFVWWPFYLFYKTSQKPRASNKIKDLISNVLVLFSMLFLLVSSFLFVYLLIYKKAPSLYGYFAYVLNPPGPLPINWHGPVWFLLGAIFLGTISNIYVLVNRGNVKEFRSGFLICLLAYGCASYYLGRSHDNNILNLLPFIFLLLLCAYSSLPVGICRTIVVAQITCIFSSGIMFGWQTWSALATSSQMLIFSPFGFRETLSYENLKTQTRLTEYFRKAKISNGHPADVARAIKFIRGDGDESYTVLDYSMVLPITATRSPWSAIHGPANFTYVPSAKRQEFLRATAHALNRPGWLIISKSFNSEEWLSDYQAAYEESKRLDFGSYYAIRYRPKL